MNQYTEFIILDIIGLVIFIKWLRLLLSDFKDDTTNWFKKIKNPLLALSLLLIPLLLVNYTNIEVIFSLKNIITKDNHYLFSTFLSLLISVLWLRYMIKLDVFNKENKKHILWVFGMAVILTLLAEIPYSLVHYLGIVDSNTAVKGFVYSVFGIGLVEESIKVVPLLIILSFSKAIDEPFDYILYATVSALGFAFVENTMYLDDYGLHIIGARALFATVIHMTFSSFIGYGIYLAKYKKTKYSGTLLIVFFFFMAILSHGFYDFWIMNPAVKGYTWLTTLFFLLSVHIWFVLKNNTLNMSDFYDENVKLNNDTLKVYLIIGLVSILMLSYLYVAFMDSSKKANEFLIRSLLIYGFVIFYIIATLTKYDLVKGITRPIKIGFDLLKTKPKK